MKSLIQCNWALFEQVVVEVCYRNGCFVEKGGEH